MGAHRWRRPAAGRRPFTRSAVAAVLALAVSGGVVGVGLAADLPVFGAPAAPQDPAAAPPPAGPAPTDEPAPRISSRAAPAEPAPRSTALREAPAEPGPAEVRAPAASAPAAAPAPAPAEPAPAQAAPAPAPAAPALVRGTPCTATARACVDLVGKRAWLIGEGAVARGPVAIRAGDAVDPTPRGVFAVQWKAEQYTSREYLVQMPYSVFFADGGIAFHEGSFETSSAGCVKLHHDDAVAFFRYLQVGDEVQVH